MHCKTERLHGSHLRNFEMPTVLKSVITAATFCFHRKPLPKGCNNRKPLSVLKPQYRE